MKTSALLLLSLLLPGLMLSHGLSEAVPSGEKGWTEEPWSDGSISSGQNASIMPDPIPLNVTEDGPRVFRLAAREVNSSDYLSRDQYENELWIRDNAAWTRYLLAHQGDRIGLVAFTPSGGPADLYRISYSSGNISHKGYDMLPGYYLMNITAFEAGRMILIFAVNNRPASAAIIDVVPPDAGVSRGTIPVESLLPQKARVIIQSETAKGYDVFVDGAFYSSDIGDGVSDGIASFALSGEKMHTIIISRRDSANKTIYNSEHKRYFRGGYTYKLNV